MVRVIRLRPSNDPYFNPASLIPKPRPTIKKINEKICKIAWSHGLPKIRIESAPSGKSKTTVIPIIIPCALSYDWTGEDPPETEELDELGEPALEEEAVAADVEVKGLESVTN